MSVVLVGRVVRKQLACDVCCFGGEGGQKAACV